MEKCLSHQGWTESISWKYTKKNKWKSSSHYNRDSSWQHVLTCLDSSSLQREYKVMNFLAKARASTNPSATNMISQISSKSGTTIAHGLKKTTSKQNVMISLHTKIKILPKGSMQNVWNFLRGILIWIAYRNRALRFSGSSVLPAYPGFMVIKSPTVGTNTISSPWKMKRFFLSLMASWMDFTWTATTDNTSTEMRLNSSKQPQAPVCASPL